MNIAQAQQTGGEIAGEVVQKVAGNFDLANIFGWAIGVGALLALGAIIWGGILVSTSELAHKKEDGKEWIKSAIFGLLLLIGAFLILNTINPEILEF